MKYNILLVEDEKNIQEFIAAYLEKEDYTVFLANDGKEGLEIFNKENIHLIILDLMLPKMSGEELCKIIRSKSDIPIIMVTAKSSEDNKIDGLSIGADDYVVKPFSPRELVSRVKALIRRSYKESNPMAEVLSFRNGDLEINLNEMTLKKNNIPMELTTNEFKLLASLISNQNIVLSRDQLIKISFGHDYDGYDRTIDTYIKNIRQKIETDPRKPSYIETVYGLGYKFSP